MLCRSPPVGHFGEQPRMRKAESVNCYIITLIFYTPKGYFTINLS